jgi:AraC family transcriptional regulator, arabinose operon regulatory protein
MQDHARALDPRVEQAMVMINSNAIITTGELRKVVANLNLSSSRFRHLFTQSIGISPTRYVKAIRLTRAKSLMETSFLTVKEVMAAVGYSDISHFVRDYKASFGETPSQSRRSLRSSKNRG